MEEGTDEEGAEIAVGAAEEEDTAAEGAGGAKIEEVEGAGGEVESLVAAEEAGGAVPLEVVGDFDGGGTAEDEATSVSGRTEEGPGGGLEVEEWFGMLFRE